mmetsp:Transcript_33570/g.78464  ORF Transcript_33570/g.78464 Transcript_33570/m.78464 type:complete len:746 (-) Transcript_33570:125-2362(-)
MPQTRGRWVAKNANQGWDQKSWQHTQQHQHQKWNSWSQPHQQQWSQDSYAKGDHYKHKSSKYHGGGGNWQQWQSTTESEPTTAAEARNLPTNTWSGYEAHQAWGVLYELVGQWSYGDVELEVCESERGDRNSLIVKTLRQGKKQPMSRLRVDNSDADDGSYIIVWALMDGSAYVLAKPGLQQVQGGSTVQWEPKDPSRQLQAIVWFAGQVMGGLEGGSLEVGIASDDFGPPLSALRPMDVGAPAPCPSAAGPPQAKSWASVVKSSIPAKAAAPPPSKESSSAAVPVESNAQSDQPQQKSSPGTADSSQAERHPATSSTENADASESTSEQKPPTPPPQQQPQPQQHQQQSRYGYGSGGHYSDNNGRYGNNSYSSGGHYNHNHYNDSGGGRYNNSNNGGNNNHYNNGHYNSSQSSQHYNQQWNGSQHHNQQQQQHKGKKGQQQQQQPKAAAMQAQARGASEQPEAHGAPSEAQAQAQQQNQQPNQPNQQQQTQQSQQMQQIPPNQHMQQSQQQMQPAPPPQSQPPASDGSAVMTAVPSNQCCAVPQQGVAPSPMVQWVGNCAMGMQCPQPVMMPMAQAGAMCEGAAPCWQPAYGPQMVAAAPCPCAGPMQGPCNYQCQWMGAAPAGFQGYAVAPAPPQMPTVHDKLREQLEYYFSDSNLVGDFFLRQKMEKDGYVPLITLVGFPKVRSLAPMNDGGMGLQSLVVEALSNSTFLEMDESCAKVRRRNGWQHFVLANASQEEAPLAST